MKMNKEVYSAQARFLKSVHQISLTILRDEKTHRSAHIFTKVTILNCIKLHPDTKHNLYCRTDRRALWLVAMV